MKDPDAEAFEFYDDPSHREPAAGRPRRRPKRPLTRHVPVRFPAETIDVVQGLAESDGITVSAWIRRAVDDALRQRGRASTPDSATTDEPLAVVEHLRRVLNQLAETLERRPPRRARSGRREKDATITNDREYRITKSEARKFEEAIASARERAGSADVDPRIHEATIEALESALTVLREQLARYEALKARNQDSRS